jgi:ligand-binding SRPBCC domain-containing protein
MAVFEHEQFVQCPADRLFDFLSRPENAVRLSRPDSRPTFTAAPEVIYQGAELEFELRAYGQVQSLVHVITAYEPPRRIVEEMVHGPLEDWVHEHLFHQHDGGVRLVDRITFEPPRGMLGWLLTEERILASLQSGFDWRTQELDRIVAAGGLS